MDWNKVEQKVLSVEKGNYCITANLFSKDKRILSLEITLTGIAAHKQRSHKKSMFFPKAFSIKTKNKTGILW